MKLHVLQPTNLHYTESGSQTEINTVEPVYNDMGLNGTSLITSDILWYQLTPHC